MRSLIAVAAAIWAVAVGAQPHSARECREGGDFIRNAALAPDLPQCGESNIIQALIERLGGSTSVLP